MSKNKVVSLIAVLILLGGVLLFINKDFLFSNDTLEEEGMDDDKAGEGKATMTADGWELSAGEYDFGTDLPPGTYDFTTLKGEMSVDGKILNKNCWLRNYMAMPGIPLRISGDGLVFMRDIIGQELSLERHENKVRIKESGYYYNGAIVSNDLGEGKVRIYCEDVLDKDFPIVVDLQNSNNRESAKRIEISSCKDSFELDVTNGQTLYVDLGKETKGWTGCVIVETVD